MKNLLVAVAVIAGILLVVLAGMYALLPAYKLPSFLPGYATLAKHHYTHAIASLGLGLALLAYAWMTTGKKK